MGDSFLKNPKERKEAKAKKNFLLGGVGNRVEEMTLGVQTLPKKA